MQDLVLEAQSLETVWMLAIYVSLGLAISALGSAVLLWLRSEPVGDEWFAETDLDLTL